MRESRISKAPFQLPLKEQRYSRPKRTFTLYVRRHAPPRTEPYARNLPLARIGLLGLHRAHFDAHALHMRPVTQLRRDRLARLCLLPAPAPDLHEGSAGCGRRSESSPRGAGSDRSSSGGGGGGKAKAVSGARERAKGTRQGRKQLPRGEKEVE